MAPPAARDTLPGVFSTTHWSVILSVGLDGSSTAMAALERLCTSYCPPLYAYVRRCGRSPEDARDLTQSFFQRLLENNRIAQADPARGRFRTFLLGAMQNFLRNEHEFRQAAKRGGGKEIISLEAQQSEEERLFEIPASEEPPDKLYERRWASRLHRSRLTPAARRIPDFGPDRIVRRARTAPVGRPDQHPLHRHRPDHERHRRRHQVHHPSPAPAISRNSPVRNCPNGRESVPSR
ncbi:MAG: sigma-70 family RNA polymerase sigma factor [Verrucomicrobia bacterium]|nr:sigma-70 family RNA polymerase sigma factor [Verrucomicrobiota bacterium]